MIAGEYIYTIADWLNIPLSCFYKYIDADEELTKLKEENVSPQRQKFQDNRPQILEKLENGESMHKISKWLKISNAAFQGYIKQDSELKKIQDRKCLCFEDKISRKST